VDPLSAILVTPGTGVTGVGIGRGVLRGMPSPRRPKPSLPQTSSVPSERSAMLFSAAAASWVTPVSPGTFAGVRTVGPAVIPRRRQYGAPGKSGID